MNDLISRQAALNALEKEKPTPFINTDGSIDPFGAGRQNQWYRDGTAIIKLPSARVEYKKGKWIRITDEPFADRFECSECGKLPPIGNFEWWLSDYCPNCGAKMEK